MKNKHLFLITALIIGSAASAQPLGEIRGRVVDPTGQPMPMATVSTQTGSNMLGTTTDMDGRFVLKPLSPGLYGVRISFVGFTSKEISGVEVVADRATYMKDTRLTFMSAMDTLIIVGYKRKLIDKDDPARMSLLAEDFVRDPNKRNPIAFVGANFVGVTPSLTGDGLHFRGSRTDDMVSFLDGVKVSGTVPRIPPSAISSVSVYTGGLPARYGDVTGGVVVIETKTYGEMYQADIARRARAAEQAAALMD
jgi:hypothetical protein